MKNVDETLKHATEVTIKKAAEQQTSPINSEARPTHTVEMYLSSVQTGFSIKKNPSTGETVTTTFSKPMNGWM